MIDTNKPRKSHRHGEGVQNLFLTVTYKSDSLLSFVENATRMVSEKLDFNDLEYKLFIDPEYKGSQYDNYYYVYGKMTALHRTHVGQVNNAPSVILRDVLVHNTEVVDRFLTFILEKAETEFPGSTILEMLRDRNMLN